MNRKILYGYQIQDGELSAHPQEAEGVKRTFSLYLSGMTQQQIADALNAEGFPYSEESPVWSRPRVVQTLRNSRYMGEKGYPALVDDETFHAAQAMRADRMRKWGDHPALCLVRKLRCGHCGHSLRRISERQWRHTLRFHCDGCGMSVTIPDADLLSEVERQAAEYTPPADAPGYTPSGGYRPADQRHQPGVGEAGTPGGGDCPDHAGHFRAVRLLPNADDSNRYPASDPGKRLRSGHSIYHHHCGERGDSDLQMTG